MCFNQRGLLYKQKTRILNHQNRKSANSILGINSYKIEIIDDLTLRGINSVYLLCNASNCVFSTSLLTDFCYQNPVDCFNRPGGVEYLGDKSKKLF